MKIIIMKKINNFFSALKGKEKIEKKIDKNQKREYMYNLNSQTRLKYYYIISVFHGCVFQ